MPDHSYSCGRTAFGEWGWLAIWHDGDVDGPFNTEEEAEAVFLREDDRSPEAPRCPR